MAKTFLRYTWFLSPEKKKWPVFVLLMEKEFKLELFGQTVLSSSIINIFFLHKHECRNNTNF